MSNNKVTITTKRRQATLTVSTEIAELIDEHIKRTPIEGLSRSQMAATLIKRGAGVSDNQHLQDTQR